MELVKAVDAYVALGILSNEKLPFADSAQIFMMKKKLKPLYELFAEEEKKLVASVAKKDESGKTQRFPDGHFEFADEEAKNTYKNNSDIDIAVFENLNKEEEYKIRNEFDQLDIIYKMDLVFVNENTKKELVEEIKKEGVEF